MITLSSSRMQRYQDCPRSYYLRYHEEQSDGQSGPYAELGTCVHGVAEWLLGRIKSGEPPSSEELPDVFTQLWIAKGHMPKGELYDSGQAMVQSFTRLMPPPEPERIVGVENRFDLQVGTVKLIGYCDLVYDHSFVTPAPGHENSPDSVQSVCVYDWKTQYQIPERAELDESIQAACYALWAAETFPNAEIETCWVFVRHDVKMRTAWNRGSLIGVRDWIHNLGRKIEDLAEQGLEAFPARLGTRCTYCNYQLGCPKMHETVEQLIPTCRQAIIEAYEEAKVRAKVADEHKKRLERAMRGMLADEPFIHGGRRYEMAKTSRRSLKARQLRQLAIQAEMDMQDFDDALSVNLSKVEKALHELPEGEQGDAFDTLEEMVTLSHYPRIKASKA